MSCFVRRMILLNELKTVVDVHFLMPRHFLACSEEYYLLKLSEVLRCKSRKLHIKGKDLFINVQVNFYRKRCCIFFSAQHFTRVLVLMVMDKMILLQFWALSVKINCNKCRTNSERNKAKC